MDGLFHGEIPETPMCHGQNFGQLLVLGDGHQSSFLGIYPLVMTNIAMV